MFVSSALLAVAEKSGYHDTLYGRTADTIQVIAILCVIISMLLLFLLCHLAIITGYRRATSAEACQLLATGVCFVVFGIIGFFGLAAPGEVISITPRQEKIDAAIDQAHTTYDRVYDEVMSYASSIHVSDEQECPQRMDASHQYICTQMSQHIASIMPIEHETSDTTWRDKEWLWRERTRELQDKQKTLKEDINRYHKLLNAQERKNNHE